MSTMLIVDDILDYSQLQAGYLQLNMGEYDLCEIVESEVSIVSTILKAHGIPYGVDCESGLICFWFLCKSICSSTLD